MTNKAANIGAGLLGGALVCGAVGMIASTAYPKSKTKIKKVTRRVAKKLERIGAQLMTVSGRM